MLDEALAAFLEVLDGYTLADVIERQPDFSPVPAPAGDVMTGW